MGRTDTLGRSLLGDESAGAALNCTGRTLNGDGNGGFESVARRSDSHGIPNSACPDGDTRAALTGTCLDCAAVDACTDAGTLGARLFDEVALGTDAIGSGGFGASAVSTFDAVTVVPGTGVLDAFRLGASVDPGALIAPGLGAGVLDAFRLGASVDPGELIAASWGAGVLDAFPLGARVSGELIAASWGAGVLDAFPLGACVDPGELIAASWGAGVLDAFPLGARVSGLGAGVLDAFRLGASVDPGELIAPGLGAGVLDAFRLGASVDPGELIAASWGAGVLDAFPLVARVSGVGAIAVGG